MRITFILIHILINIVDNFPAYLLIHEYQNVDNYTYSLLIHNCTYISTIIYLLHSHYIKYGTCLYFSLSCDILPRWSLPIGLSYIKHRTPGGTMLYMVLCITKAHHNYWNSHDVPLPEKNHSIGSCAYFIIPHLHHISTS